MMDKVAEYKFVGKFTGQESKHFNTVFQYENQREGLSNCDGCLGGTSMYFYFFKLFKKVFYIIKLKLILSRSNGADCSLCWASRVGHKGKKTFSIRKFRFRFVNQIEITQKLKDPAACLGTLRAGYLGAYKAPEYTADDVTPCVSWVQKFW